MNRREKMNDNDRKHIEIAEEAVRIARDYPELSYKNAIEKAKEMLINETLRTNGNVSECMELN